MGYNHHFYSLSCPSIILSRKVFIVCVVHLRQCFIRYGWPNACRLCFFLPMLSCQYFKWSFHILKKTPWVHIVKFFKMFSVWTGPADLCENLIFITCPVLLVSICADGRPLYRKGSSHSFPRTACCTLSRAEPCHRHLLNYTKAFKNLMWSGLLSVNFHLLSWDKTQAPRNRVMLLGFFFQPGPAAALAPNKHTKIYSNH